MGWFRRFQAPPPNGMGQEFLAFPLVLLGFPWFSFGFAWFSLVFPRRPPVERDARRAGPPPPLWNVVPGGLARRPPVERAPPAGPAQENQGKPKENQAKPKENQAKPRKT